MPQEQWGDEKMRCFGMLLDGRSQVTGIRQRGKQATLLIVINDYHDLVEFTLPECPGGDTWSLLIDTNIADNSEKGSFKVGDSYGVTCTLFARVCPGSGRAITNGVPILELQTGSRMGHPFFTSSPASCCRSSPANPAPADCARGQRLPMKRLFAPPGTWPRPERPAKL